MLYGDLVHVKKMLASANADWTGAPTDRLTKIQQAVSAALEQELGRTFGAGQAAGAKAVRAPGTSDLLVLPEPARSIASVVFGQIWTGSGWTGGTAIPASAYRPWPVRADGLILGLTTADGSWWAGTYVVTGTWEGTDAVAAGDVPADVHQAANLLIAEHYKREEAGPAGFSGPDGSTIPVRDPWKDPLVRRVIARHRVPASGVVV